ncbi:ASCH domain-containing protein [Nocardia brasiliensis]|uniref:ASCH domain-containing protein n=1 Tax=Nocardia brasiliensis TaxID=37326 RepID=UPI002453E3BD|nr:ASCH domain-containing protein [Nocardia brasiliensis]
MDQIEVGRIALMSIHPQYAKAIVCGKKRVEFRKRPLARDVTHVIVYATAPVKAVVAAFEVKGQQVLPPSELWRRFRMVGGISKRDFFAYYADGVAGVGIEVGKVFTPPEPLSLCGDFGIARPPQSYQYIQDTVPEAFTNAHGEAVSLNHPERQLSLLARA